MQCTQISCNKRGTEITSHKIREVKKVNMKSRLHHYNAKKVYNRVYKAVLTTVKSCLNNDITKKKKSETQFLLFFLFTCQCFNSL